MRDRLVHHYFDIDLDVLWQTVTDDLPRLLAAVPDPDRADPAPGRGDESTGTDSSEAPPR